MRTVYEIQLFERFRFSADLTEASASIYIVGDDGLDDTCTPYQTADAGHNLHEAAKLALLYCGRDYYAKPGDDRDDYEIVSDLIDGEEIETVSVE